MALKDVILKVFGWWDGATIGTLVWTRRNGTKVGEDAAGNAFYQTADGKRRWIIYKGPNDGSRVPPEWDGWLRHAWADPPTVRPLPRKAWEKPHVPNLTGTDMAYVPRGSILRPDPVERRDYDAWTPE